MNCPSCHREIAEYSNFCYYCGAPQPNAPRAAAPEPRRLERSLVDSKVAGVCGGLGHYYDMDPTVVRLLWVLVTFVTGIVPGLVVYGVAWLIMPPGPQPISVPPMPETQQASRAPQP